MAGQAANKTILVVPYGATIDWVSSIGRNGMQTTAPCCDSCTALSNEGDTGLATVKDKGLKFLNDGDE